MKFSIKIKNVEQPVDASKTNIVIDKLGIKLNATETESCLTLMSASKDTINLIKFEEIESVETSKGTYKLDHTMPVEELVEEFKNVYVKEDSKELKVTFNNVDNKSGKKEITVPRRTTIKEAIDLVKPVVEGKDPTYEITVPGPSTPITAKNITDPILEDTTINITWVDKKFTVTFKNVDPVTPEEPKDKVVESVVWGTTLGEVKLANNIENRAYILSTIYENGTEATDDDLIKADTTVICKWAPAGLVP